MTLATHRALSHRNRKRLRNKSIRRLRLEALEDRQLLAIDLAGVPDWEERGPSPMINGQSENIDSTGPGADPVIGAVHTLALHPTDSDIAYLGGANGGVWRSTDFTNNNPTYEPLTDQFRSLSMGALEFDPTDATNNTLVAGVGRYSAHFGTGGDLTGLLKTTDGGDTWEQLGNTTIADGGLQGVNVSGVGPRGDTILVSSSSGGAAGGVYRSTDGGETFDLLSGTNGLPTGRVLDLVGDPSDNDLFYVTISGVGIYRTPDLGDNWVNASADASLTTAFTTGVNNNAEMAVHPTTGRIFAGVLQAGQVTYIGFSDDSGDNWTQMDLPVILLGTEDITNATNAAPIVITTATANAYRNGDLVRISGVAGNTAANGEWFVTVTNNTTFSLNGSNGTLSGAYVASAVDFARELGRLNPTNNPGGQGGIHFSILVDPTNDDIVYVGGDRQDSPFPNPLGATDFTGNLFRGDANVPPVNPGALNNEFSPQWEHLTHTQNAGFAGGGTANSSAPHADSREARFRADGILIEGNDGGIYRRTSPSDNTGDWFSKMSDAAGGLQIAEMHDIAYDNNANIIISGNQDTGTVEEITTGGIVYRSVSVADGGDVAVDNLIGGGNSLRYSSTQNLGGLRRRVMNAANGEVDDDPVGLNSGADPAPTGFFFVTPLAVNEGQANRLIIGAGNGIYESSDNGDNIARISTSTINGTTAGVTNGVPIAYGTVGNPEALYVGSGTSVLVRTALNGSLTAAPAIPGGGTVQDIDMDPDDFMHAIVVDRSQVFETFDGGDNWDNITGDLVDPELQSVEYIPLPGGESAILAGGRYGVHRMLSTSPGIWTELGADLPNASVWDMDYDAVDDILVVGTMGRGAWVVEDLSVVVDDTPVLNICGDEDQVNQDDVIRLVLNVGNPLLLDVYLNSMAPVFTVPLAVLQQINVFGIGGNDQLTVDSSFGLIDVLNGIRYDGDGACPGTQPGYGYDRGFDTLILDQIPDEGDVQDSDTYSVGPAIGSGTSVIVGDSGTQTVYFEELEPVIDLVPADDLLVNATAEPNAINYVSAVTITRGLITIDNYESLEFGEKVHVTINAGLGNDTVNLNNELTPSDLTGLTVNAGDGDDAVTTRTEVSVPVNFSGGAGHDTLDASGAVAGATIVGGAGNDYLVGGPGDDGLIGDEGDDIMVASPGNNSYNGAPGFDTILVQGTLSNDVIDVDQTTAAAVTITVNGSTSSETITAMEQVQIQARQGNDLVRVTTADNLGASSVLRYYVQGDAPNASDRLIVTDDGVGDLVILRQAPDERSGRVTVAPSTSNAEVIYEGIERLDILPIDPVTGGTGAGGGGQIKVFHSDPFEYNDNRLVAGQLARVPESPTSPVIDPGGFATPFEVPGDEDWYEFRPQATGTFSVKILFDLLDEVPSGRPGLPGDGNLSLDIYEADGDLITSGVVAPGGKEAIFAATNDPAFPDFNRIFVRVRGATTDSINVYDFDNLTGLGTGNPGVENVDIFGPQVIDVTVNDLTTAEYNLFGVKPGNADQGPTPLVDSLLIHLQDLPPRAAGFLYAALDAGLTPDEARGLFELRGDANGIVAIDNVIIVNPAPAAIGDIPTATIRLVFAQPLPDDRFTLTIDDSLRDPVGNRLDGESNADEPSGAPFFPSGDGNAGGDFVARFTVDSRAEIGTFALGTSYIDINGNTVVDPHGTDRDATNRDIAFLFGFRDDRIFAGNFAPTGAGPGSDSGFDKLGAYGQAGTGSAWRWRLDFNHDGEIDYDVASGVNTQGDPVAGNFSAAHPGDEIGLFNSGKWWLDATGNNNIGDPGDVVIQGGNMKGQPIVGDFDGDGLDDLGTWDPGNAGTNFDGVFSFDFANNGLNGNAQATIQFDVSGVFQKAVAADMNGDGIDDIGLFVSRREGVAPAEAAEWYFLISGGVPVTGTVNTLNHPFTPVPFGNDLFAQFGDEAALPVVGNFDPPASSAAEITDPGHNPRDPMDVDNDGVVAPADVLTVINYINSSDAGESQSTFFIMTAPFLDVDADQSIAPSDALSIINYLNSLTDEQDGISSDLGVEGEANDVYFESFSSNSDDDALLSLLASTAESSPRRRR